MEIVDSHDLLTTQQKATHMGVSFLGKEGVILASGVGAGTAGVVSASGGAAAALEGMLGVTAVSVAAAAGAIVSQMNYKYRRDHLREMYKHEVGAVLGKSADKVTNKDIELVAKGSPEEGIEANKSIAEGLDKLKKSRNVGVLVSALSILATVAMMVFAGPVITAAVSDVLVGGTLAAAVPYAAFITKASIAFGIHHVLEKPIDWVGKKLFGVEQTTTHERISSLEKDHRDGKFLGREQVLGVFVGANEQLNQFVQAQYGKQYDKLSVHDKRAVADIFEKYVPITKITESLNSGQVRVSELAFSVEGKASGVVPGTIADSRSIIGKAREKLHEVGTHISNKLQNTPVVKAAVASEPKASVAPKRAVVEYDNPAPKVSFVERENQRRTAALAPSSPTIH